MNNPRCVECGYMLADDEYGELCDNCVLTRGYEDRKAYIRELIDNRYKTSKEYIKMLLNKYNLIGGSYV